MVISLLIDWAKLILSTRVHSCFLTTGISIVFLWRLISVNSLLGMTSFASFSICLPALPTKVVRPISPPHLLFKAENFPIAKYLSIFTEINEALNLDIFEAC